MPKGEYRKVEYQMVEFRKAENIVFSVDVLNYAGALLFLEPESNFSNLEPRVV